MHRIWVWGRLYIWVCVCVCDSSLLLLPLNPITYNQEGLVSFASSHFSSLFTWVFCFAILDTNIHGFGVRGTFDYLFK